MNSVGINIGETRGVNKESHRGIVVLFTFTRIDNSVASSAPPPFSSVVSRTQRATNIPPRKRGELLFFFISSSLRNNARDLNAHIAHRCQWSGFSQTRANRACRFENGPCGRDRAASADSRGISLSPTRTKKNGRKRHGRCEG